MRHPLAKPLLFAALGATCLALVANTISLPTGLALALVVLAIFVSVALAVQADAHRRGLRTRLDRQRSHTGAAQ